MTAPRVSVLMTTRNGAAWIGASLDSVFAQTFADYELVVVDDASVDATPALLAGRQDARLRVIRNASCQGIAGARNIGLAACAGQYVAVLDHDDVSPPGRLAQQVAYLDRHPAVVQLGTGVSILRGGLTSDACRMPGVSPAGMRLLLHLGNPLTWSSMMFRRSALLAAAQDGAVLRQAAEPADDLDLYHRLLAHGEAARLDEVLTQYRWHAGNTTHRVAAQMAERAAEVLARAYAPWFTTPAAMDAARLVARPLSNRAAVPDSPTLDRLLAIVAQVGASFPGAECARLVARVRRELLRAAVRGGRPEMVWRRWGDMAWTADGIASLAVGVARRVGGRGRQP